MTKHESIFWTASAADRDPPAQQAQGGQTQPLDRYMSVKDEKRENEDLKSRLAALQQKPPVEPVQTTKPSARKAPKPKPKRQHSKSTSKSLCHYMYVSLEEDRSLKRQIGRFISIIGETMGASEVLRVMMFLSLDATDEQIIAAYEKAIQGDGKRMK